MLKFAQLLRNKATIASLTSNRVRAHSVTIDEDTLTEFVSDKDASIDPDAPIEMENPYQKEKKRCILCKMNITPDYKNVKLLSQFQSPYTGRIYGRHITGLCKQKQEQIQRAIIRAQNCAMMPTYHKDTDFLQDPSLFDPERPIRPHKY